MTKSLFNINPIPKYYHDSFYRSKGMLTPRERYRQSRRNVFHSFFMEDAYEDTDFDRYEDAYLDLSNSAW